LAVGFLTDDIATTLKAIQKSGGVLLGVLNVLPKAGVDGGDYAFQFSELQTTVSMPLFKTGTITLTDPEGGTISTRSVSVKPIWSARLADMFWNPGYYGTRYMLPFPCAMT